MALQSDGKTVIGGYFGNVDSVARRYVARLNADGKLDTGFSSGTGPDSNLSALALQPDGKIYVGGLFISFNGTNRGGIARLNATGGLDATFNSNPGASGSVRGIAVQSDGKVVIGGGFSSYSGSSFGNVARVVGDSILDFAAPGFFALENGGTATVNIGRAGDTNSTVTVNFATSNLTAIAGRDYTATNGTLTFTAGQTTKS